MKVQQSKTVVFIHGAFVTHQTWNNWAVYFEQKGYNVIVPPWPHRDKEAEVLRSGQYDAEIASTRLVDLVRFYSALIKDLPEKPIIIGHSMGGLLVQLLIQKGLATAGVAIHSVPPQGVMTFKLSFFRSTFGPLGFFTSTKKPHMMSLSGWKYAITNGQPLEEQQESYTRFAIPESKLLIRDGLTAEASVDFEKPHVPLLFIAGSTDHIMPASLNFDNFKCYDDDTSETEFKEFEGRNHFSIGLESWKEEADYILKWLTRKR